MDLKEALDRCDQVLMGTLHVGREALRIVLGAARERHLARTVEATTNAATARALEATEDGVCSACGGSYGP